MTSGATPSRDLNLDLDPPRVALRPRVLGSSAINTEAVLWDAALGTVEKHGRRRSTSNSNCEAVLRDAGLGAIGKHGHRSSTSNLSTSPRSGGSGDIKGSGPPPAPPPPPPDRADGEEGEGR